MAAINVFVNFSVDETFLTKEIAEIISDGTGRPLQKIMVSIQQVCMQQGLVNKPLTKLENENFDSQYNNSNLITKINGIDEFNTQKICSYQKSIDNSYLNQKNRIIKTNDNFNYSTEIEKMDYDNTNIDKNYFEIDELSGIFKEDSLKQKPLIQSKNNSVLKIKINEKIRSSSNVAITNINSNLNYQKNILPNQNCIEKVHTKPSNLLDNLTIDVDTSAIPNFNQENKKLEQIKDDSLLSLKQMEDESSDYSDTNIEEKAMWITGIIFGINEDHHRLEKLCGYMHSKLLSLIDLPIGGLQCNLRYGDSTIFRFSNLQNVSECKNNLKQDIDD